MRELSKVRESGLCGVEGSVCVVPSETFATCVRSYEILRFKQYMCEPLELSASLPCRRARPLWRLLDEPREVTNKALCSILQAGSQAGELVE